ncbi:MAG: hypothetical protein HY556_02890 [Euryarchaeota archaeon]|nr:hypothetical protein [Euryarchaeota archaeon]
MKSATIMTQLALALVTMLAATSLAAAQTNNATNSTGNGSGFGVTPVELEFTDPALLRGQAYEGQFRLNNQFDETLTITTEPQGVMASWISVNPANPFTISPGTARILKVTLTVPADAANGDYAGAVRIHAQSGGSPAGSGASVNMELVPAITAKVGGVETLRFSLEAAKIADAEADKPLSVIVDVINTGNVRAAPSFDVQVYDENGDSVLVETIQGSSVPASGHATQAPRTVKGLPVGEYEATVALSENGDLAPFRGLLFKVVPAGTLSLSEGKQGSFVSLDADRAVKPNGLAKLSAAFKNTGAKDIINAKLNAEISLDGERIAVITSDPVFVPAGEEMEIPMYWTAGEAGTYKVTGWVTFDGLKSVSKDVEILVSSTASGSTDGSGSKSNTMTGGSNDSTGSKASDDSGKSSDQGARTPGLGLLEALSVAAVAGIAFGRRSRK